MGSSLKQIRSCFLLVLLASLTMAKAKVFNVLDYGAVRDGKTDSTKAFQNAWNEACASRGKIQMLVPEGTFLVGPLTFRGPCKTLMVFQLEGIMLASSDLKIYIDNWVEFHYIDWLLITGKGKFHGQGALAWPGKGSKRLPTSVDFSFVTNATVQGISSVDSKTVHMQVFACQNMKLRNIRITAPYDSPNTDGIHLGNSNNIEITNSVIGTGDDCISVGPGNKNINISKIFCGPGHGISVGSLGGVKGEGDVVGLTVKNCTLTDTTNGVRIKTWRDTPSASVASHFTFDDIVMNNVENPIIIDQKYCPNNNCNPKGSPSKVKISDIKFQHIRGNSKTQVAISLICSSAFPCQGVELQDIVLNYIGDKRGKATTSCENVHGRSIGTVTPPSCV